jgi:V/A-type H+-transporting ATPase subunit I
MFVSQRMKKIDVLVLSKDSTAVSREVVKFGDFQLIEIGQGKLRELKLEKRRNDDHVNILMEYDRKVSFLLSALESNTLFSEAVREMGEQMEPGKSGEVEMDFRPIGFSDLERMTREIESELNRYNVEMEKIKTRKEELGVRIQRAMFFSSMDLDWQRFKALHYTYLGFGTIPTNSYAGFQEALSQIPLTEHSVIGNEEKDTIVFFAASKTVKSELDQILKNVYFHDYGTPLDLEENFRSRILRYGFELSVVHDEELFLEKKFVKISGRYLETLDKLRKSVKYYLSMERVQEEMGATANAVVFSGWVPKSKVKELENSLETITGERVAYMEQNAMEAFETEGLVPPTKLSNPKILKPFELLTNTFGTPGYREIDPTLFAALGYVLMFGAMFGDIGHGLILAAIGAWMMLSKSLKNFFSFSAIIFSVGLSAAFFGFVYGAIFGNEHLVQALWLHPAEHIMTILGVAVAFGVLMLTFAMVLNMINSVMEKNWGRLLFSSNGVAGFVFYWSVLALVLTSLAGIKLNTWIFLGPIIATGLIMLFEKKLERLFFPHHGDHAPASLLNSFFELFEALLAFLSNTVSFVRVGAFALNHGSLMSVVFLIAGDPKTSSPITHWIALLIGNLIVLGLEGFIVAIQSLRLEYYEFFTRFFRANGKRFEGVGIFQKSE